MTGWALSSRSRCVMSICQCFKRKGSIGQAPLRLDWWTVLQLFDLAQDSIVSALETIADAQPIVFHCAAGKDRTGVLAALLRGCLGVEAEAVVSEYAVARHSREEIVNFLRRRPSYVERLDQLRPSALDSDPGTMRQFLVLLDKGYGGAQLGIERRGFRNGSTPVGVDPTRARRV